MKAALGQLALHSEPPFVSFVTFCSKNERAAARNNSASVGMSQAS
jgi:hypothetical protein